MSNKIIVQCPACTTKFSIGPDQIEGIDEPRFHCSRCGHYFTHKMDSHAVAPIPQPPKPAFEEKPLLGSSESPAAAAESTISRSRQETTLIGQRDLYNLREKTAEQMPLIPEPEKEPASLSGGMLSGKAATDEELPVYTAEWPDTPSATSSGFSAPEQGESEPQIIADWPANPATETAAAPIPPAEEIFADKESAARASQHTEIYQRPSKSMFGNMGSQNKADRPKLDSLNDFESKPVKEPTAKETFFNEPPKKRKYSVGESLGGAVSSVKNAISGVKIKPSVKLDPGKLLGQSAAAGSLGKVKEFIGPVALMCAVPALFASGFFAWGANLDHTPSAVASLLHLQTGHLPRVAPPGLELVGVQSESITLESGEKVVEINGMLFNSTIEPYDEIKIEAKLYSEDNTPVQTLVVNAANALQSASQLSALRVDALEKLQTRAALGMMPLKSHEHVPFRMVFTAPAKDAKWFSARVYSVRPGSDS